MKIMGLPKASQIILNNKWGIKQVLICRVFLCEYEVILFIKFNQKNIFLYVGLKQGF